MHMLVAANARALAGGTEQISTRLIFLISGLAVAAWAPLVPFARQRLGNVDEGTLRLLLLCFGIGSIVAMPFTGILTARTGCERVIIVAGLATILALPSLAVLQTPLSMGVALVVFGAGIGTWMSR